MNLPWLNPYIDQLNEDNLHHSMIISGREPKIINKARFLFLNKLIKSFLK